LESLWKIDKGDIIAFTQNISRDWYRLFVSLEQSHKEDVRKLGELHAKDLETFSEGLENTLFRKLNDTVKPLGMGLKALQNDSETLEKAQKKLSQDLLHSETELKKLKNNNENTQKRLNKLIEAWNAFVPRWSKRQGN
jgi:septal ring factor EnvC (AmiA/AmiB activator)